MKRRRPYRSPLVHVTKDPYSTSFQTQFLPFFSLNFNFLIYSHVSLNDGDTSEKCVVMWSHHCANIIECTHTNIDGLAYNTPRPRGTAYCSQATNLHVTVLNVTVLNTVGNGNTMATVYVSKHRKGTVKRQWYNLMGSPLYTQSVWLKHCYVTHDCILCEHSSTSGYLHSLLL